MTHQTLVATIGILILAATAAPRIGISQPVLEPGASDIQQHLVETVQREQAQGGIGSPKLIEPLAALGLFYAEHGDHDLAIAAVERARQVVRINYGLYSLREVPLLWQLVRSEQARGNSEARWNLEQRLLRLARRHPDDLRTVPILRKLGDRRLDIARRYYAGEFPPEIILGCYYARHRPLHSRNCHAGSKGAALNSLRSEGWGYHLEADRIERQGYDSSR